MEITKNTRVGEIVTQNLAYAKTLDNYGIDFCCQGKRTLLEACEEGNLSVDTVLSALQENKELETTTTDYTGWQLGELASFIEQNHHKYVEEASPIIAQYIEKIVRVHGAQHAELIEVQQLFNEIKGELAIHMKKEELILFPAIKKLANTSGNKSDGKGHFTNIANPIHQMESEHELEGFKIKRLRAITNNFTPPADACNSYKHTYALLKEFETDLYQHIHLENNILFPKAIALD